MELHYTISLLMENHINVRRMLAVIRKMCDGLNDGAAVDENDIRQMIDFNRSYADEYHHAKEENILFPEMIRYIPPADGIINGVMLPEHEEGRLHTGNAEKALNQYLEELSDGPEQAMIHEILLYADVLEEHTIKEDNVLYMIAEQHMPEEIFSDMDGRCRAFEEKAAGEGTRDKYLTMLDKLEKKYGVTA